MVVGLLTGGGGGMQGCKTPSCATTEFKSMAPFFSFLAAVVGATMLSQLLLLK